MNHTDRNELIAGYDVVSKRFGVDENGTFINACREIGLILLLIDTIVIELQGVLVMRPGVCRCESEKTLNESRGVVVIVEDVFRVHILLPTDGQINRSRCSNICVDRLAAG